MALFNYATRELSAKVVYYGPGLSGKTTNIEKVHELLKPGQKGKLISLPTETDRTLFFDFLPVQLGRIKGFNVRFHLYTVPGQVFYNATRRLVLQGVDGVVFVADSQEGMKESNLESLRNLEENLSSYGKKIDELPFLIQFNKRDLKKVQSAEAMNESLNRWKVPTCEASALTGEGVIETLSLISRLVFQNLRKTLLLPGETAADEMDAKFGETFGTGVEKAPPPPPPPAERVEDLEEIADLEEITEGKEGASPAAEPFPSRFGEGIPFPPADEGEAVPDEIDLPDGDAAEHPAPAVPSTAAHVESSTPAGAEAPSGAESVFRFDEIDQMEYHPPTPESLAPPQVATAPTPPPVAPADAPPSTAHPAVPSISVEAEEGSSLTFLRFDPPSVNTEGQAVIPMVFLDGDGNTFHVRMRIQMEDR